MADLTRELLDALLHAVVERGNGYSGVLAEPGGPDVRFDAARAERDAEGGVGIVASFTCTERDGVPRALEYRVPPADGLFDELAEGSEDADGFATIVAVLVWEEIATIGVDAAVANGTFTEAGG